MELKEYILSGVEAKNISKWIWGLYKGGKEIQVRAACSFARHCLPIWQNHKDCGGWECCFGSDSIRKALIKAEQWLKNPSEENRLEIVKVLPMAKIDMGKAYFASDEASGSAERVASRDRAACAASSTVSACEAATWTENNAKIGFKHDLNEVEARIEAGPSLECVDAISSAIESTQLNINEVKDLLLKSLVNENIESLKSDQVTYCITL